MEVDHDADYIGFGPVFATHTKRAAGAALGPEALARAVAAVDIPVVAIGGIRLDHLPVIRAAGARHWAVISDILGHPDPADRARRFRW
jgi:thiamine-phosphate pyrophosphorylase